MKKTLLSLAIVLSAGAVVAGATGAFLSDTETSSGNTFTAGAIDLKIDNTSYYNDEPNPGTSWSLGNLDGKLFFNFLDLKPGDEGEDTISIHVDTNDAWACMNIEITATDDNGLTEPEEEDGDTTGGVGEGELQQEINFVWWKDDGDNVLEIGEEVGVFKEATLGGLNGFAVSLADTSGNAIFGPDPLVGGETYYIGKAWCYGKMQITPLAQDGQGSTVSQQNPFGTNGPDKRPQGVTCDGSLLDNTTQTDSVVGNLSFSAVQSRHNPGFLCNGGGFGCTEKADVMLVLDRSGSISPGELATMKTAAKAFVDALAPSTAGIHVGLVSFSSSATLNHHLSDDGTSVKTAIDALSVGGTTNLADGISTADLELDDAGDGHDRPDGDSPDIIVIITDGAPNTGGDGSAEATAAKNDGIEIFAVGIGISQVGEDLLKNSIVSSPSSTHYFPAGNFSDLSLILAGIAACAQ
ncbi:VWA domain-containing protein [Patescibacteria group bacterium]|nr:VWA domain-containing protein [Patescibacteria group bacterium]